MIIKMDKKKYLKNLLTKLQKQSKRIREIEDDIKKLIREKSDFEHKKEILEAEALLVKLDQF